MTLLNELAAHGFADLADAFTNCPDAFKGESERTPWTFHYGAIAKHCGYNTKTIHCRLTALKLFLERQGYQ